MKRLLLLRHAQAMPAEGGSDIDRPLSPKGLGDALALGKVLKAKGLVPAHILCSSAKRTQQTCAEVLKGLDVPVHAEFSKKVYSAGLGDLLELIQSTDDGLGSLMIIGHNPTIYELAVRMSAEGSESVLNHLGQGYAPATLSVIEADVARWAEVCLGAGRITALLDPLDYNAPARPTRWT
ncbi:MAG: histidine phosphatase family protein [Alphaproteobacteria bacterium]